MAKTAQMIVTLAIILGFVCLIPLELGMSNEPRGMSTTIESEVKLAKNAGGGMAKPDGLDAQPAACDSPTKDIPLFC